MDLSRTINTLNHRHLLTKLKLKNMVFNELLLNKWKTILQFYYLCCFQKIKISNSYGSWSEMVTGVPQNFRTTTFYYLFKWFVFIPRRNIFKRALTWDFISGEMKYFFISGYGLSLMTVYIMQPPEIKLVVSVFHCGHSDR